MFEGILQFYYLYGVLQHGTKLPVDLQFRPSVYQRLFYNTTEIESHQSQKQEIIEKLITESVETIVAINKTKLYLTTLNADMTPKNSTRLERLLKRPFYDRLEEQELPGDLRSRDHPFGFTWMLFPRPESLMIPNRHLYEGQKWSVKMITNRFEIHYELTEIDHKRNEAHINGHKGICLHDSGSSKKWNATWIVDTRTGVIKRMELKLDHEHASPKRTTHITVSKILTREADEHTVFDYEIDARHNDDL